MFVYFHFKSKSQPIKGLYVLNGFNSNTQAKYCS